jgi:hypothetical protein
MSEIILTRVQRCRYCKREMSCPPLDYEQSPFCAGCMKERVRKASPRDGVQWRIEGRYVIPEASRKHASDARRHHQG